MKLTVLFWLVFAVAIRAQLTSPPAPPTNSIAHRPLFIKTIPARPRLAVAHGVAISFQTPVAPGWLTEIQTRTNLLLGFWYSAAWYPDDGQPVTFPMTNTGPVFFRTRSVSLTLSPPGP